MNTLRKALQARHRETLAEISSSARMPARLRSNTCPPKLWLR
jgi:hypothetical protein